MATTPTPVFTLTDVLGPEMIEQYLGDGMDSVLQRIVLQNVTQSSGNYSAYVAVQTSDPSPIELIGDSILLDFSKAPSGGGRPQPLPTDNPDGGLLSIGTISVTTKPFSISITLGVGVMFSSDLLTPQDGSDAVSIPVAMTISFDSKGIHLTAPQLTLPACAVGDTGITVQGGPVTLALWGSDGNQALTALGIDSQFRGVVLQGLIVTLPSDLQDSSGALAPGTLTFTTATIGSTGFSGKMSATFPNGPTITFLGADLTLAGIALDIEHNSFAGGAITGTLQLPFFDQPVNVTIAPGDGGWGLSLTGGLADMTIDGVLEVELTSLGVQRTDGDVWFKISATVTPQLTVSGLLSADDWPTLTLKDVLIDEHGNIKASGGKMALSSQQSLSLGKVFKAKLTQFSFGTDANNTRFLSLSGEIDLVAGASLTAVFNDMRIGWDGSFSLKGLQVNASEAGVFTAQGKVDFIPPPVSGSPPAITPSSVNSPSLSSHGFQGSVKIGIPSAGLSINASVSVLEVSDQNGNHYTALFIDMSVQIPGGIPLWASGLAIQAIEGLIGWNYGPTVDDQFSGNWFNWFLGNTTGTVTSGSTSTIGVGASTVGATPAKWEPQYNARTFGVGVSLGTLPDVGFSWHSAIIFVIVLPGPDLILSGSCNFISKPAGLSDSSSYSGAFSVLIVYDGNAETLDAMITANVGQDPILTASGAAEAFFNFNDPGAWYLDIGTQAKPLQASALKIFTATAYFDLDKQELDFGVSAGFNKKYTLGPLSASAKLTAGLTAQVIFKPTSLATTATLSGALGLHAFGVGVDISVDASVSLNLNAATSTTSASFDVKAELDAELDINLVFTHIHVGGKINLEVSGGGYTNPSPPPLPLDTIMMAHPLVNTTWPLPLLPERTSDGLAGGSPVTPNPQPPDPAVVPPDSLPTITFSVPMNDTTGVNSPIPVSDYKQYGNSEYKFTVTNVTIEQLDASGNPVSQVPGITGKWSAGAIPNTYTLQLWADTPASAASLSMTLPTNRLADQQAILGPPPCAPIGYTPATACAPMSDSDEVPLGDSYAAIPPDNTFDGITLDDSWKLGQDQAPGTRVIWFCALSRLSFTSPVSVITFQPGSFSTSGYFPQEQPELAGVFCAASGTAPPGPSGTSSAAAASFAVFDPGDQPVPFTASLAGNIYTITCPSGAGSVQFLDAMAVVQVCYTTQEEAQKQQAAAQANNANQAALQAGTSAAASSNPTLLPWTNYSLTVTTQAAGLQNGQPITGIPGVPGSTFTDVATFTTSGPPGVSQSPGASPNGSALNPLADLSLYLQATVPLGDAARVASGRYESAYCGYDLAMYFNQPYVPNMYVNASAPLQLNAIELNNIALTSNGSYNDSSGTPIAGATVAQTSTVTIPPHTSGARNRWATQMLGCGFQQQYPDDSGLAVPMDTHASLAPRRRYNLTATAETTTVSPVVVASADLTTSRFLTVSHHLQSFPDILFTQQATDPAQFTGAAASIPAMPTSVTSAEASQFNDMWNATGLADHPPPPVETLDITAIQDDQAHIIGLLIVSPEPIPWDRVSWSAEFTGMAVQPLRPLAAKISDIYTGVPSYIEISLLQDANPAGWQLHAAGLLEGGILTSNLIYTFGDSGVYPAGTIFRIFYSGSSSTTPADIITGSISSIPPAAITAITLKDVNSAALHTRTLIVESAYAAATLSTVRNTDGTMFILQNMSPGNAITPFPNTGGELRLTITVLRDVGGDPTRTWPRCGDSSNELTRLHIPFPQQGRVPPRAPKITA